MINLDKVKEDFTEDEQLRYHAAGLKAVLDHRDHIDSWWKHNLKKYSLRFAIAEVFRYIFLLTLLYVLKIKI